MVCGRKFTIDPSLRHHNLQERLGAKGHAVGREQLPAADVFAGSGGRYKDHRQVHGGAGVCDDFPLASMYAHLRTLRLADGPDEIHKRTIARQELRRWAS